jgi:GxxExxY protein
MSETTKCEDKSLLFEDLTYKIIGAALEVYKVIGFGFAQDVYEKALLKEFDLRGIPARSNCRIQISYKGDTIPCYLPNILVDDKVIVELQVNEQYCPGNYYDIINYLKVTGLKVGLIINFGRDGCKPRRFVHD